MKPTKEQPLTRRERERERHRREILSSAEEIFSLKGIAGTTVEDIAKRADYAVGSIYNFFTGKEDLIRHVHLRLIKSRIADIEKHVLPLSHDPEAALRALTELWVSHYTRHGAFLRMAFTFKMTGMKHPQEPGCDEEIKKSREHYEHVGSRFFADGIKTGHFHPLPPEHLMLIFEGICRAFHFSWERHSNNRPKTELANELYTAVFAALTGKCHAKTAE